MPISIALPAPNIEFYGSFSYPTGLPTAILGTALAVNDTNSRSRPKTNQLTTGIASIISTAGAGVIGPRAEVVADRICCRVSSTATVQGDGWKTDLWAPSFDAGTFNPGALLEPPSVVAIWDIHVAAFQTAFVAGSADRTGFGFIPLILLATPYPDSTLGGAAPTGGFAIYLNDDGGGNNQWEFVSYDAVPATLLRVPIGPAIIPDVTLWSSFRFTIVSAAAGRPAELSLEVNRTSIVGVTGIAFDDVVLMRPNTLAAFASGFTLGQSLAPMGGAGYRYSLFARFGRFNAAGEELQVA